MSLILHHLLKDIRAQRWLLLLVLIVIAAQIGVNLLELQADYHLASIAEFIRTTLALPLIGTVLWILLLVRLIQSEPVIGETSFWLTRPVPRRVYIPSKLLFILLFLVIPYFIPLPVDMLLYGVSPVQLGDTLRAGLLLDAYLLLVVLWLATFTRTMASFWGGLIVGALATILVIAGVAYSRFLFQDYGVGSAERMLTRWALFIIILFSGLFLSLALEHTRRKARIGFRIGVFFIALAVLAVLFCPFTLPAGFVSNFVTGVTSYSSSGRALKIQYADDWRQRLTWMKNPQTNEWILMGAFNPVTKDSALPIIQGVTVTFQSQPGMPDKLSNNVAGPLPADTQFDSAQTIASDLPGIQLNNASQDFSHGSLSLFVLNGAGSTRVLGKTGTLKLSLYGRTQTLVREAAIPLRGSPLARLPGQLIHVTRLDKAPFSYLTNPNTDKPVLAVWNLSYNQEDDGFQHPDRFYVLVDPPNHTGTFLHTNGQQNTLDQIFFSSKGTRHAYLPLKGDEPLDRLVLYIYELKQKDFFTAALTVPDFKMDPK